MSIVAVQQVVNSYATVAQPVASGRRMQMLYKGTGHGISLMHGISMHGISQPRIEYDTQNRS